MDRNSNAYNAFEAITKFSETEGSLAA